MQKILFVITKDDIGGAQKYVRELAECLDSQKFQASVLTGGSKGARFLSNSIRPHFLFVNDILALLELFLVFRREKPDIVHLNSSKAGVIGSIAAKLARVPRVIFTAHGWVFNPDNNLSWLRKRFYILLHKIAAHFQDSIISVSDYDFQLAVRHRIASRKKLATIYNGIAPVNFIGKAEARRILGKLTGAQADDKKIWVGSIGRLVAEKDYETLLEAAALIPNALFVIIGSGYELPKLKAKIKKLSLEGRCLIVEQLAPAAPYLKAFDIFLLTSIKEGLPYTMLEAMAADVPLVVTRIGGMTEIVQGRGLVMPPREPEEIARAIKYYLENPDEAKKFAAAAKQFLNDKLTLSRMVQETERVYLA